MNSDPCPYCGGTCSTGFTTCVGYEVDIDGVLAKASARKLQASLDEIARQRNMNHDLVAVTGTKQMHGKFYFRLIHDLSKFDLGDKITVIKKNANSKDLQLAKQIGQLYEG